jgi:hypothetical protein
MEKRSTLAVALAAMMLLGAIFAAPQKSYAHTFSGDESAGFLELVENIKIELGLVQSNLASNMTLAEQHAEHAQGYLDEDTLSEIEERNERLATDLPAAMEDLHNTLANSTEQQVQTKIQNINDLLGETVSVRVEPDQLTNSTVQALVLANLLTSISFQGEGHYEIALGIGEEHTHGEDHDEAGHDEHTEMQHSSESSGNMTTGPVEIVNMAHYQTARAVAVRAQELWTGLKTMAPASASQAVLEIDSALPDLVDAIDAKATNGDIQAIIHARIHPNLMTAFGIELAHMMTGEDDHMMTGEGDEHESHSMIPEKLMMYAEETGDHIHEQHMAENAPISDMYEADTRYTLTLDGDAQITLELAAWKSTGKVLHLDITGGSITLDSETMTVNAGQAYYIANNRLMYAFAVAMPEDGGSAELLKIRAVFPEDSTLSDATSNVPLDARVKIGSDWSSDMTGQVALS